MKKILLLKNHPNLTSMMLVFPLNSQSDHAYQIIFFHPVPQGVPQRHLFVTEQANLQISICSDSQPVARAAKHVWHRGDETDLTDKTWDFPSLKTFQEIRKRKIFNFFPTFDVSFGLFASGVKSGQTDRILDNIVLYGTILSTSHLLPENGMYSMNRTSKFLCSVSFTKSTTSSSLKPRK